MVATSLIPALWRERQVDHLYEFEASLVSVASFRTARRHSETLFQKTKKQNKAK